MLQLLLWLRVVVVVVVVFFLFVVVVVVLLFLLLCFLRCLLNLTSAKLALFCATLPLVVPGRNINKLPLLAVSMLRLLWCWLGVLFDVVVIVVGAVVIKPPDFPCV